MISKSLNISSLQTDARISLNRNLESKILKESLYVRIDSTKVQSDVKKLKELKWQKNECKNVLADSVQKVLIGNKKRYFKHVDIDKLIVLNEDKSQYVVANSFIKNFENSFKNNVLFGYDQFITKYSKINSEINDIALGYMIRLDSQYYSFENNSFLPSQKLENLLIIGGEISDAKSSEEVKSVIAKNALPVASYKIKRRRPSWMVTAYMGFGANYYTNTNVDQFSLAVTAPVGIEYNSPIPIFRLTKSMSFMAVLFDVGNVVKYRTLGETDENSVDFESIFSPGFLFSVGLSNKLPLSLNLSYLTNSDRMNVGFAFDLPLFNLSGSY